MHESLQAAKVLEKCQATNSRNDKAKLLKDNRKNKYLKKLFDIAYHPGICYYIKLDVNKLIKLPNESLSPKESFKLFLKLESDLRERVYTGNIAARKVTKCFKKIHPKLRLWMINAINRDLRVGINYSTFSKIWKDMECDFGVALANSMTDRYGKIVKVPKFPCFGEPKYDGINLTAIFEGPKYPITFNIPGVDKLCLSRGMEHYPMVENLWRKISKHIKKDRYVCGEAYAKWDDKEKLIYKSPWSKASSLLRTGMTPTGFKPESLSEEFKETFKRDFQLMLFEYGKNSFFSKEHDYTDPTPRFKRRKCLKKLVKNINDPHILITPCVIINNIKEARGYYKKCLDKGFEGAMFKNMNAPLVMERNDDMLKLKPFKRIDGVIVGVHHGNGRNSKWAGSISVFLPKFKSVVSCSVRNDKDRFEFWRDRKTIVGLQAEFKVQEETKGAEVSNSRFIVYDRPRFDLKKWAPTKVARIVGKYS